MIKVLIVEDQALPRQLLELFIKDSGRYETVGTLIDADHTEKAIEAAKPDLILMDIYTDMGASGLDAAARVKKRYPEIKIIIMTSLPECSYLNRAREIGVDSFWYKESDEKPILELMDRTMRGEHIFADETPIIPFGETNSHDISRREYEVLREIVTGATNMEISEKLMISSTTVKTHIQNMLLKTGFRTRTELAVKARELGLVIPDKVSMKKKEES